MGAAVPPLLSVMMSEEDRTEVVRSWCREQNIMRAVVAGAAMLATVTCIGVAMFSLWWLQ